MALRRIVFLLLLALAAGARAQPADPRQLTGLVQGAQSLQPLRLPTEAKELGLFSDFHNGLFRPAGDGPFPALVIAHSCGGIRDPEATYWAQAGLKEGYVVLVIDSMRGNRNNCIPPVPIPTGRLVKDLYDAAGQLARLPIVDAKRMAVLGFSQGAFSAALLASPGIKEALASDAPRFAATAGLYGTCLWPAGTFKGVDWPYRYVFFDTDRPLLYLMAEEDLEASSSYCDDTLPALRDKGAPVEWHKYPGVTHCWDCSALDGFSKTDFRGTRITYHYDKAVTEDSRKRVFEFLARQLPH
ncbi:prolyl oligopeptidase [Ramlibacter sp. G-1-2-2]|uniref:Prolyl oligopeptidase n=1 Tax=Ramlibacter agri TaxID=2728837 RepID=A0A848HA44_9BURK|nr:dienelactone hydrolase family protein [Ramlibacter agri]NML46379.1 prolyl oligopeptidase [Ramlibacter agri]